MQKNLIVVDSFYSNPHEVREAALNMEYTEAGNYPGFRTEPLTNDGTKEAIQNILQEPIRNWHDSGRFQICTAPQRSWIHADKNDWAALVFLSEDAPLSSGTSFYKHKSSGSFGSNGLDENMVDFDGMPLNIPGYHYSDPYEWEFVDRVANRFNRLIIFRGNLWHKSDDYFGEDLNNGRLFQLFFMTGGTHE